MSRLEMTEVQPRSNHRLNLASVVAAVVVVAVVAGTAYLLATRPPDNTPAVAVPVATPAATAAPAPDRMVPTPTPAAEASPGGTAYQDAAPNGTTVDDLAGTWTGLFFTPVYGGSVPFGQKSLADYDERLTIPPGCVVGGPCGSCVSTVSPSAQVHYALTYLGYREDVAAFIFDERSGACPSEGLCTEQHQLALTPMPGGATLGGMVSNGLRLNDVAWNWFGLFRAAAP